MSFDHLQGHDPVGEEEALAPKAKPTAKVEEPADEPVKKSGK